MKIKIGLFILAVLLLIPLAGFSKSTNKAKYKVIYKGKYRFVYLFVDGKDYGKLRRKKWKTVTVEADTSHKLSVARRGKSSRQVVHIATGEIKEIIFLEVKKKGSTRAVKKYLIVKYSGTYKKVTVSINGKEYGEIGQENERRFLLQASLKYKIVLEAGENKSSKIVYLSHLADRFVNFFSPSE